MQPERALSTLKKGHFSTLTGRYFSHISIGNEVKKSMIELHSHANTLNAFSSWVEVMFDFYQVVFTLILSSLFDLSSSHLLALAVLVPIVPFD